jgi:ankyrin repeat protein
MSSLVIDALKNQASLESTLALMERGDFDIDYQEPVLWPLFDGNTALLFAIQNQREDVAHELILRGANVELTNKFGQTPLGIACSLNLKTTVHALVQAGADTNLPDDGSNPLGKAARQGHFSMVRVMLSWGADPSRVDLNGKTARQWAKTYRRLEVVNFLDACDSILVVISAGQVRRLAAQSALKFLPKDLCRVVGSMLV